jgi:hypothetical protein
VFLFRSSVSSIIIIIKVGMDYVLQTIEHWLAWQPRQMDTALPREPTQKLSLSNTPRGEPNRVGI